MHTIFLPRNKSGISNNGKIFIQPARPRVAPTPPEQWPLWTRAIAKFRHSEDRGLGDTVVHLIGDTRSERFKKWYRRKFGHTCGCTDRQRQLNEKFPYPA